MYYIAMEYLTDVLTFYYYYDLIGVETCTSRQKLNQTFTYIVQSSREIEVSKLSSSEKIEACYASFQIAKQNRIDFEVLFSRVFTHVRVRENSQRVLVTGL